MKRTLISGASGFVGSNLVRRLLRDGHEVHLLLRPGYRSWRLDLIRQDVRLHVVSLDDAHGLAAVLKEIRPDWVFHLAAYGAYSWQNDLHTMVQTNLIGTMNLVQACLLVGFECLVNTGSSSEYGLKPYAPSEREWLDPNSHYAVTKASATLFCRFTAQDRRVRIPTLRLYSVYGPFEEPARLIPQLIVNGLKRRLPPLVQRTVVRDYVYVDDVTEAYLLAASHTTENPGPVYNVGSGRQTTIEELVGMARQILGIETIPQWGSMADRSWDTDCWVADSSQIRSCLGWEPRFTLEEGFRAMLEWYRSEKSHALVYDLECRAM